MECPVDALRGMKVYSRTRRIHATCALCTSAWPSEGWGIHDDAASSTISARDLLPGTCFYPVPDQLPTRYWWFAYFRSLRRRGYRDSCCDAGSRTCFLAVVSVVRDSIRKSPTMQSTGAGVENTRENALQDSTSNIP